MSCPRCTGRLIPDDDGKTCLQCGFVLYSGKDASEVYWQQFQQRLAIVPQVEEAKTGGTRYRYRDGNRYRPRSA